MPPSLPPKKFLILTSCALADAVSARIVAVQSSKRVMFWSLVVGLIAERRPSMAVGSAS
jgi:hypothetical protein